GPLVRGHLERAGLHTVTAAHALVRVVHHRAEGGLLDRSDGTYRGTGRLGAIHTQPTAEAFAVRLDGGELVSGEIFLSRYFVVVWEAPTLRTSSFASLTTDAEGAVVQDRFRHIKTLNSLLAEFRAQV